MQYGSSVPRLSPPPALQILKFQFRSFLPYSDLITEKGITASGSTFAVRVVAKLLDSGQCAALTFTSRGSGGGGGIGEVPGMQI
jgi:hypothetical protein